MTYIKKAYRGLHEYRYQENPLEKKFALAWYKEHGEPPFDDRLRMILRPQEQPRHKAPAPSDRDRLVAATMIQWLGSPVGQNFLANVVRGVRPRKGGLSTSFSRAWKAENSPPFGDTFRYLMCPPSRPQNNPPEVSDRDRFVAEKVMEWVGSEEGLKFIVRTMDGKVPGAKPVFARRA